MATREEKYWQADSSKIKVILLGGMKKYAETVPGLSRAFVLSDHSLRCMDEGTPDGIHCAGSGILLKLDDIKKGFTEARLDGIYSHAGCGAAALYAKQQGLDAEFADEYGKEWAKSLATNLGIPYRGHIEAGEMKRPSSLHVARVAYFDGTGTFSPSACPDLPQGFVISRRYMAPEYARKEVEVAIDIALGHHGFGSKFSANDPFLLVAVASKSDADLSINKLKNELQSVASKFGRKIKVDGFEIEM